MITNVLNKLVANDWHQRLTKASGLKLLDYSQNESVERRA